MKTRTDLTEQKVIFAQDHAAMTDFTEMVKTLKPSVIIGNFQYPEALLNYHLTNYYQLTVDCFTQVHPPKEEHSHKRFSKQWEKSMSAL